MNDTVQNNDVYNVTWNPYATIVGQLSCDLNIVNLFNIHAEGYCNAGYAHAPFTVLLQGGMDSNDFILWAEAEAGWCNLNVTSAFYECQWTEEVIGGDPCYYTNPRALDVFEWVFPWSQRWDIWPQ